MYKENYIYSLQELKAIAKEIRKDIVKSIYAAGSGHTGGSLGLADIFTALYFAEIKHKPNKPEWEERDRVILSIGHVAPVLYTTLAHAGYFEIEELQTLRKFGSRLQGHPGRDHFLPGLELSAGSLGQGLSVAVGMALSAKIDNKSTRIYSIHGDGELQEGSVWEAAMSAAHYKLDNLVAIVDRNYVQIDGKTESVMALEPLAQKWIAFGWNVIECNGNDIAEVTKTLKSAKTVKGKPTVIVAKTIMGKGVSSIEDNYTWHGKAPNESETFDFLKQIEKS